jgi:hypothetical protein
MSTTEPDSELTAPERLAVLAALGELTPAEQAEWDEVREGDPALRDSADDWTAIAAALEKSEIRNSKPEIPAAVVARFDAVRAGVQASAATPDVVHALACSPPAPDTLKREQRTKTVRRFSTFTRVTLALAACVALSLILLQDGTPPPVEDGIKSAPPVVLPATPVEWLAPGAETRLLQPAIVWKGTPGQRYHLRLEDAAGTAIAWAQSVQSPWLLEEPLAAGATYTVHLEPDRSAPTAPAQIKDQPAAPAAATTFRFRVLPDAVPVEADLLAQMQALVEAGHRTDALSLLYRLPEEALTVEEFRDWRGKLDRM